jgi:hypothetical protein
MDDDPQSDELLAHEDNYTDDESEREHDTLECPQCEGSIHISLPTCPKCNHELKMTKSGYLADDFIVDEDEEEEGEEEEDVEEEEEEEEVDFSDESSESEEEIDLASGTDDETEDPPVVIVPTGERMTTRSMRGVSKLKRPFSALVAEDETYIK